MSHCPGNCRYSLQAVVMHAGSHSCQGHYYSYTIRTLKDERGVSACGSKWLKMDDSRVSSVEEDEVLH
ncbi:unnamed protein product, partial [Choristocarpus tenellus]